MKAMIPSYDEDLKRPDQIDRFHELGCHSRTILCLHTNL
jgi:hypothetical protein